jgi:hypothetical protein
MICLLNVRLFEAFTTFGGAVSAGSKASDAARDLLMFLKSPTAIRVIKAQGVEPIGGDAPSARKGASFPPARPSSATDAVDGSSTGT